MPRLHWLALTLLLADALKGARCQEEKAAVVTVTKKETENQISDEALSSIGEPALCGYNGKKLTKITEGQEAGKRDWPWMAVLLRKDDLFHYCGGALVTRRHVLTAAHCVHRSKPTDMIVRLGEYDFERSGETLTSDLAVAEIRSHPDFDPNSYEHDVAVLALAKRAVYGLFVQPLCLPELGPSYANVTAVVAGWGTLFYGGPMSEVLMEVPVPVWEQKSCTSSFAQAIFETVLCAGEPEGGKDSCQGDSGGPLMIQREDKRWATIGIVSWGIRCGEKGKPGVYTRVNRYLKWIAAKIQDV